VEAAEALGRGRPGILFRHILPNVISPIVIQTAVCLSDGILTLAPWVSLFPGESIMLAVLALNVLGDGLRDALDPRAEMR